MDAKEYLQQAQRLDLRIRSLNSERKDLKELITSLSSPQFGDKVMSSPNGDPQFVKQMEKIWELDEIISQEIDLLMELRMQIYTVLAKLEKYDYQLILRYIYLNGYSVETAAEKMGLSRRTITRWHKEALAQVELPQVPITI